MITFNFKVIPKIVGLLKKFLPGLLKRRVKFFIRNCSDSISYYLFQKRNSCQFRPKSIIFICKGNICRSAFAEYYMKMKDHGLDVKVESFGLDVDQGKFSPPEAIETAREFGVDLSKNISRKLTQDDIEKAGLIIPMEYSQFVRIVELCSVNKDSVRLMRECAPFPSSLFCNIDDPFGWNKKEFSRSFTLIQKSIDNLCKELAF